MIELFKGLVNGFNYVFKGILGGEVNLLLVGVPVKVLR
jgi:hypothetical protein